MSASVPTHRWQSGSRAATCSPRLRAGLLHLAPDIQEQLLFLLRVTEGKDPITERELRAIVAEAWRWKQRRMWRGLRL